MIDGLDRLIEMIEKRYGRLGRLCADTILLLGVVAAIAGLMQLIYATAITPVAHAIAGLTSAFSTPTEQRQLLQSFVQLGISLSGVGAGALALIAMQRQWERKAGSLIRKSENLLEDSSAIQRRVKHFIARINAEGSPERKTALLKELMEGEFSLDEPIGTQSPQGTERKMLR